MSGPVEQPATPPDEIIVSYVYVVYRGTLQDRAYRTETEAGARRDYMNEMHPKGVAYKVYPIAVYGQSTRPQVARRERR
jgi:hypothetical protein